ncbi:hypothetical protein KJ359_004393 [Pestalotiopsis sp. 9143b]|nr:hypothetical protein KJ359_004393 [Pestalotiopsis sp. 9143b]
MITRGRWAEKTLIRYLTPIVQKSLDKRPFLGSEARHGAPANCVQWIIDMTPRKDPWPASRTASYAVEDLCLHTDHVEPLRDEIRRSTEKGASRDVEALPLLDSFLRESVRMTNSDAGKLQCRNLAVLVYFALQ